MDIRMYTEQCIKGLRSSSRPLPCPRAPRRAVQRQQRKLRQKILASSGVAKRIFQEQQQNIEGDPMRFLQITEAYWKGLKSNFVKPQTTARQVVQQVNTPLTGEMDFDACICGGTLGIFVALALQLKGFRTCIVERRRVQGRTQEWNISRGEVQALVDLGLVTQEELEEAIVTEFNPIRVGFKGGEDIWVNDCLNLGVHPETLIAKMLQRYRDAGGAVLEGFAFMKADVHNDGVRVEVKKGGNAGLLQLGDTNRPNAVDASMLPGTKPSTPAPAPPPTPSPQSPQSPEQQRAEAAAATGALRTRLLLDCMGHYSDIVKQMRVGTAPDGMCLVVGGCAEGFSDEGNTAGDLLYTFTDAERDMQLFWEAFPAEGGKARTTYMFTYSDAHPSRPTFEQLLDRYFELLPQYQGVELEQLKFKRVLFGGFPCYNNGPLQPGFDRVLQVGDASASASPLSFGGFGSMVRHIPRLSSALSQALETNSLSRASLSLIQPYQPSLSAAWLFQRSMSVRAGQLKSAELEAHPLSEAELLASEAELQAAEAELLTLEREAMVARAAANNIVSSGSLRSMVRTPEWEREEAYAAAVAAGLAPAAMYSSAAVSSAAWSSDAASLASFPPSSGGSGGVFSADAGASSTSSTMKDGSGVALSTAGSGGWLPTDHVNALLACNFKVMKVLGDSVLRPFLQDTIVAGPLSLTMAGMMLVDPITIMRVFGQVGPSVLLSWFGHYTMLLTYRALFVLLQPLRPVVTDYSFQRWIDALEYGSGSDYNYHAPKTIVQVPEYYLSKAEAGEAGRREAGSTSNGSSGAASNGAALNGVASNGSDAQKALGAEGVEEEGAAVALQPVVVEARVKDLA